MRSIHRRGWVALLAQVAAVCALASSSGGARADTSSTDTVRPPSEHRLTWTYPRFRPPEYVASAVLMGAGLWLEEATRGNPNNGERGGILLDDFTRNALVLETADARYRVATISDTVWPVTQYFPIADSLLTPLLTDKGNLDVALQMTLINWEVQGTAFLLTRATHRIVGRWRPSNKGCAKDPKYADACGSGEGLTASFLSGHASMSFASAGLTCAHHIALPLYGGNALDAAICALALTAATSVGVMRVMADKHWWSDVIAGTTIGTATGFGLPFLFHYSAFATRIPNAVVGGATLHLLPIASDTTAGVSVLGVQ